MGGKEDWPGVWPTEYSAAPGFPQPHLSSSQTDAGIPANWGHAQDSGDETPVAIERHTAQRFEGVAENVSATRDLLPGF